MLTFWLAFVGVPIASYGQEVAPKPESGSCTLVDRRLIANFPLNQRGSTIIFTLLSNNGTPLAKQATERDKATTNVPLLWSNLAFRSDVGRVTCELATDELNAVPSVRYCASENSLHVDEGPTIDHVDVMWGTNWLLVSASVAYIAMISGGNRSAKGSIVGFDLDKGPVIWSVLDSTNVLSAAFFGLTKGEHTLTIGLRSPYNPGEAAALFPVRKLCITF
jgi:hypothetical protein